MVVLHWLTCELRCTTHTCMIGRAYGDWQSEVAWVTSIGVGRLQRHMDDRRTLGGGLLEPSNQVVPILVLLESSESHFGPWDVLLWILKVFEQGVLIPSNSLLNVGLSVREALSLASLATEEAVEVRADLVAAARLDGVALGAA